MEEAIEGGEEQETLEMGNIAELEEVRGSAATTTTTTTTTTPSKERKSAASLFHVRPQPKPVKYTQPLIPAHQSTERDISVGLEETDDLSLAPLPTTTTTTTRLSSSPSSSSSSEETSRDQLLISLYSRADPRPLLYPYPFTSTTRQFIFIEDLPASNDTGGNKRLETIGGMCGHFEDLVENSWVRIKSAEPIKGAVSRARYKLSDGRSCEVYGNVKVIDLLLDVDLPESLRRRMRDDASHLFLSRPVEPMLLELVPSVENVWSTRETREEMDKMARSRDAKVVMKKMKLIWREISAWSWSEEEGWVEHGRKEEEEVKAKTEEQGEIEDEEEEGEIANGG